MISLGVVASARVGLPFDIYFDIYETISTSVTTNNITKSIHNRAIALGWDGVHPVNYELTILVYTYVLGTPGARATSGKNSLEIDRNQFPAGSVITINNYGYIYGGGGGGGSSGYYPSSWVYDGVGNGGDAITISSSGNSIEININNIGSLAGGGGGGETMYGGVSGGGGAPYGAAGNFWDTFHFVNYGSSGDLASGGSGFSFASYHGGNGGNIGEAGGIGSGAAAGYGVGASGKYISGNAYVTWINTGTRLGSYS